MPRLLAVGFPQHPDEYRSERSILLAVDQELCEDAALRVAPELSNPLGSFEVREQEDVEEFGAGGAVVVTAAPLGARRGTPIRVMILRRTVGELLYITAVEAGYVDPRLWAAQGEDDPPAVRRETDVEGVHC